MLPALRHIRCWIFDLDNSLYPASSDLFALIDIRMSEFIQKHMGVGPDEARRIQKRHFHQHGTTLSGLMAEGGVDPHEFLDYVHDIDLARISADPRIAFAISQLPGRKMIFTNGDAAYAGRVLDKLGLGGLFDELHDIHAMGYVPKPDPRCYAQLCQRYHINPSHALFVEDMARNLAPAKALGMTTVWIDNGSEQASHAADHAFIDYRIEDLGDWLTEILEGNGDDSRT